MKTYWGWGGGSIAPHTLLTLALDEGEWSSHLGHFPT